MKSENRNSEGTLRLGTTHLHYMGILLYLLKRTAIAVPLTVSQDQADPTQEYIPQVATLILSAHEVLRISSVQLKLRARA
jgi:hypothetical protein